MMLKNIIKDQRRLFWTLHVGGWLAWGLVVKFGLTWATFEEIAPNYFLYVMVISTIGMILSFGLRMIYRRLWGRAPWQQAMGFVLGCAAGGFLWMKSRSYIYYHWIEKAKDMEAWREEMGSAAEIYEKVNYMETILASSTVMVFSIPFAVR
jgi:hypothetical protein